eukprot:TRINITY_DN111523_c0_g1_i1.p1 TRINITY_DN111523_c0_g1~~TRINITY_DN111523_c0_g1_i1.p1  ORF type:complete len:472 (-),score=51.35 TRINITY_DN111523_c0_g1_i1:250-1665(-)
MRFCFYVVATAAFFIERGCSTPPEPSVHVHEYDPPENAKPEEEGGDSGFDSGLDDTLYGSIDITEGIHHHGNGHTYVGDHDHEPIWGGINVPVNNVPTNHVPGETPEQVEIDAKNVDTATCVLNSIQAVEYTALAAYTINSATTSCAATQSARNLCAGDIAGVIAAFAAVSSFISGAVTTCPDAENVKAGCASIITGLIDAVMEVVQPINYLVTDCPLAASTRRLDSEGNASSSGVQWPEEDVNESRRLQSPDGIRIGWCVISALIAPGWLARAGVQIKASTLTCDSSKTVCAANAMGVVGSFLTAGSFISPMAHTCGADVNVKALCAGEIFQLLANLNNIAAAGTAMQEACGEHVLNPDLVVGGDRRLQQPPSKPATPRAKSPEWLAKKKRLEDLTEHWVGVVASSRGMEKEAYKAAARTHWAGLEADYAAGTGQFAGMAGQPPSGPPMAAVNEAPSAYAAPRRAEAILI